MTYKSESNKFLVLARGDDGTLKVELDDVLDGYACDLDSFFIAEGVRATLTSAIRSREKQLNIIRQKAIDHALILPQVSDLETADLEQPAEWNGIQIPLWHIVWSGVLSAGEMVNPPEPARAQFEYRHADGRLIPAGNLVGISSHQKKEAIDISGPSLVKIAGVIEKAKAKLPIRSYLIEPKPQNCVHIAFNRANGTV